MILVAFFHCHRKLSLSFILRSKLIPTLQLAAVVSFYILVAGRGRFWYTSQTMYSCMSVGIMSCRACLKTVMECGKVECYPRYLFCV